MPITRVLSSVLVDVCSPSPTLFPSLPFYSLENSPIHMLHVLPAKVVERMQNGPHSVPMIPKGFEFSCSMQGMGGVHHAQ